MPGSERGLLYLGVSQNQGFLFGGPHNKDYSLLGSLYLGKLPFVLGRREVDLEGFRVSREVALKIKALPHRSWGFMGTPLEKNSQNKEHVNAFLRRVTGPTKCVFLLEVASGSSTRTPNKTILMSATRFRVWEA